MNKLVAVLCATAFLSLSAAPAIADDFETLEGKVERITMTIKLKDGSSKMFEVAPDVNLDKVDEGDEVRFEIDESDEIQSIKVTKEDKDSPRKKKK